ncbi:MAG: N-acetylmuramoyl-L-alanine amidase [Kiritimatiellae bacterium]|nr:N-acetylmuramoyl-L-alanine amidase [Kiritimatiellia bacterium]
MAAARGFFAKACLTAALAVLAAHPAAAIDASNRYRSPRNPERKIRQSTELIVLHTTEAPARGSLLKVSERGECHFLVTEEGAVYRIVDRDREAFHAGRSMWNGKEDVDKFSIGIECVGYHDKEMPLVQLYAIRDLVKDLKKMYHLTDDKVVTHSQVAYGAPNKWQKKKHRGRKRCGMLFAMPSVRRVLELKSRVSADPDTRAKRLTVGDDYLAKVLYGNVDTLKGAYGKVPVKTEVKPAAPKPAAKSAPKPAVASKPASPAKPPPKPPSQPAKPFRRIPVTIEDLKAQGYTMKGAVRKGVTASQIAGAKWNSATTYYTIRDKVIPGNMINPAKIEVGMCIWMK